MTKKEFKDQFIVNFLSTWCAINYDDCCMRGQHDRLENPPVEDADWLADKAWIKLQENK